MTANGRIVLLDGYAHIYRAFFAIRELTNPAGEPVNALYGMARFTLSLDRDHPHEFGALVLDRGRPARRLELLPQYKATRPPMPEALRRQVPRVREWLAAAGWPILEEDGREADDLIAAVVGVRAGHETFMVSHDKDLAQLVAPGVCLLAPAPKGGFVRVDDAGVREKYGVPPAALRDWLAMVGDASDNVPGVDGIGPKTAAELLNRFGSIDGVYAHLDEVVRPALRERLAGARDLLLRNVALVALDTRLPAGWAGLDSLRRREPDWAALLALARDHGFKSLVGAIEKARDEAASPRLF